MNALKTLKRLGLAAAGGITLSSCVGPSLYGPGGYPQPGYGPVPDLRGAQLGGGGIYRPPYVESEGYYQPRYRTPRQQLNELNSTLKAYERLRKTADRIRGNNNKKSHRHHHNDCD